MKEKDVNWINAMYEELHQFESSKVCHLVPRIDDISILRTRWIYRNKADMHGNAMKNKTKLIVQGFKKKE